MYYIIFRDSSRKKGKGRKKEKNKNKKNKENCNPNLTSSEPFEISLVRVEQRGVMEHNHEGLRGMSAYNNGYQLLR